MNEFEDRLSEALSSRGQEADPTPGSLVDVRRRARRRTRRRTAVGASALAAVGAVGVAALVTSGSSGNDRLLTASGDDESAANDAAASDSGLWRCTGPIVHGGAIAPSGTVEPTVVASIVEPSSTFVEVSPPIDSTSTVPVIDPSVATTTSLEPIGESSTTVGIAPTSTVNAEGIASSTTTPLSPYIDGSNSAFYFQHCELLPGDQDGSSGDTAAPNAVGEGTGPAATEPVLDPDPTNPASCISPGPTSLVLSPICWQRTVDQGLAVGAYLETVKAYVATELPSGYLLTAAEDGDTLVSIADKFGVTPEQLSAANGGDPAMFIHLYQPLLVPPAS